MGTSAAFQTPKGGDWTDLKRDITDRLHGNDAIAPEQIIGGTFLAIGGLGPSIASSSTSSGSKGGGGSGGGRGSRTLGGKASVGRAVSGLAGFGAGVRDQGLDATLEAFGLAELQGCPAAEVIARIAEHLAEDLPGTQGELLIAALKEAIFEVAAMEGDRTYENLEGTLQAFLTRDGIEGLVECFLSRLVFDRVWFHVENHVQAKAATALEAKALATAVEGSIKGHVRDLIKDKKTSGQFNKLDWFGATGQRFGQEIASDLESRVNGLHTPRS